MIAAWLVHLYTASGFVLAFLAAVAAVDHDFRSAFFFLAVQIAVDATDGVLARAARVSERLPWFSGSKLDDLVDYLTYVFVPALIVWQALLVVDPWTHVVPAAMLLASGYGFSRTDAKTTDHFFTGFPSYWNIVVFYLFLLDLGPWLNAMILLGFAALVFVPIRYIYPSRTPVLAWPTNLLGVAWGAAMLVTMWQYPAFSRTLVLVSLAYPAYYFVLSLIVGSRAPGRSEDLPLRGRSDLPPREGGSDLPLRRKQ
jgi:phosphatidylcholine synthase